MTNSFRPTEELKIGTLTYKTSIDGLLYIDRELKGDDRGFFSEVGHIPVLRELAGIDFSIQQINHARSNKNVVRGIHAEGWNKFIFVTQGKAFCALADLRPESPTFKKVETFVLGFGEGALNGSLYVPMGVGNSYAVLDGPMDYVYFVDRLYADRDKSGDAAISLFDPDLTIEWPISKEEMILSERDKSAVSITEKII